MRFGIFFSYWEKEWKGDYFKYVPKVRDLGFDALEVSAGALLDMTRAELRELGALAASLDVGISANLGPAKQYDVGSSDPAVRAAGLRYYRALFAAMDAMDCRKLIGALHSYWPFDFTAPATKQQMWDNAVQSLAIMGADARDYGIELSLEVLNRFDGPVLNTAAEAVQFCREVGSPAVKIHLDTFHMNIEEDDIPTAIRTAGPLLGHMHVCQGNRRLPRPGSVRIDWQAIGRALADVGYEQYIIMEPFCTSGHQIGNDTYIWRDLTEYGPDEASLDRAAAESVRFLREAFGR